MPTPALPTPAVTQLRLAALLATALLALLCLAWELWLAPTGQRTLVIKALPLLAALPGLARHRLYTYRWLSLAVWLYALEGAVRGYGDAGLTGVLAWAEVVLAVVVFTACGLYVRARLRAGRHVTAS